MQTLSEAGVAHFASAAGSGYTNLIKDRRSCAAEGSSITAQERTNGDKTSRYI